MEKTALVNLLPIVLICAPTLAIADINNSNATQTLSQPSSSMLAAQPTVAGANPYGDENKSADTESQNKDILITAPKNVVGGSLHETSDISRYLGIDY